MVCSQHSSLPWFFPFRQILASSAALKSDFCHLSEITLPAWTSRFVSRKYPQVKGWSNHGAHFTCFHSLKDHSPAVPVSHFYSRLWWQGYSDVSCSVMMRSRGCSDFTFWELFLFVYPAEHCTQPDYVSCLIWWYPIGKYFERVIEMNEINHHRNFRDHLKDLKIHHTYWFSVTHQSLYSATTMKIPEFLITPSAPSW